MMRPTRERTLALLCGPLLVSACIPYTVATTAAPVPEGEMRSAAVGYLVPYSDMRSSEDRPLWNPALDYDLRIGKSPRSDIGIRIPSFSGVVVNYKRLLSDSSSRMQVAIMPGAGLVNVFEHALGEFTLLLSAREEPALVGMRGRTPIQIYPYGGLRVMQVLPLNPHAVHDRPTAGGFFGVRIYDGNVGVSPEVGVFYDHSALGLRRSDLVIVPAISLQLDGLMSRTRRGNPPPRRPRPIPPTIPRPSVGA